MYQIYDDWKNSDLDELCEIVKADGFMYHVAPTVIPGIKSLAHQLQARIEDTNGVANPNSKYYHLVIKIAYKFCFEHNIDFDLVCRSSINYTHPSVDSEYPKHNDHPYDHIVLIFYLNDSDGDTILYDDQNNIIKSVSPVKGRVLVFNGAIQHGVSPPTLKERIVLNVTLGKLSIFGE